MAGAAGTGGTALGDVLAGAAAAYSARIARSDGGAEKRNGALVLGAGGLHKVRLG